MNKFKNWIIDYLKSIGVGLACMIPGVSGGTVAVLMKIYDKMVNAIASLFKTFVKSFLVLLPIALGVITGVAIGFFGVKLAFTYILFSIVALFAGLILGSIPSIAKEVKGEKVKPSYIVTFVVALVFVLAIAGLSFYFQIDGNHSVMSLLNQHKWHVYVIMVPVGVLASFALVTPGISGSMLLMVIGFYQPIIDIISDLKNFDDNFTHYIVLMICFLVGIAIGFITISKLMKFLLGKFRVITFYGILGFIVGSLPALFLNYDIWNGYMTSETTRYLGIVANPIELALGIPLFVVGAVASFLVLRLLNKPKENEVKDNA